MSVLNGGWVVWLTLALALLLSVIHLPAWWPAWLGWLRPNWLGLVVAFWVLAVPHRFGLLAAWTAGLLQDVLINDPLGLNAVVLAVLAWVVAQLYERLRMFTALQQALLLFLVLLLAEGTRQLSLWLLRDEPFSAGLVQCGAGEFGAVAPGARPAAAGAACGASALTLILGSASPRRAELLASIGASFQVRPANLDETRAPFESARAYVRRLALAKARAVWSAGPPSALVLGADTVVVCDELVLGKPRDRAHGLAMLARLSGRTHQVLTAVALVSAGRRAAVLGETQVSFRSVSATEARVYWDSGEPHDKAGGYGIQGAAGIFVERLDGSYSNVVGLPLVETRLLLQVFGA